MTRLPDSIAAWCGDSFKTTLQKEIETLGPDALPLQQGVSQGGFAEADNLQVTVFGVFDDIDTIQAKIGLFFTEIVINCGCGDDPMPINAYCEMWVNINKSTAEAEFTLISDDS